jgi:DNA-binding transcriptional MocR family regulator
LTIKHDDKILELSVKWISIDDMMNDHSGDKQEVIQAVNRLENTGYLESRSIKNTILYKEQNKVQDRIQFSKMMETFVINQKKEIEDISTIPTIMLSDGSQFGFSKKGLELLEHVQEEIDRAHMIIIRTDYQDKIRSLQHPIAIQRITVLF